MKHVVSTELTRKAHSRHDVSLGARQSLAQEALS